MTLVGVSTLEFNFDQKCVHVFYVVLLDDCYYKKNPRLFSGVLILPLKTSWLLNKK